MAIPTFDKFKSVTAEGKVADYDEIADVPIIRRDLTGVFDKTIGYYQHIGETTITYATNGIYFWNGEEFKAIDGKGFMPLIMRSGTIGIIVNSYPTPVVGKSYPVNGSFNRNFEEGEYCFGLVTTAEERIYAIIGNLWHDSENELNITIHTAYDITGPQGEQGPAGANGTDGVNGADGSDGKDALILQSGTVDGTISTQRSCVIVDPVFNREYVSRETCFAVLTQDTNTYVVIGTVAKHTYDSNVSLTPTVVNVISGGTASSKAMTVTLLANNWMSGTGTYNLDIEGLSTEDNVIISPSGNPSNYAEHNIYCQGAYSGGLIFACETVPIVDIDLNILIL